MKADAWLQLGVAGAALFVVLVVMSFVVYRIVMRVIDRLTDPMQSIADELRRNSAETAGVGARVSRIEGKLDSHFGWTPVETPRAPPPGYYSHVRPKSEPGSGRR